MRKYIKIEFEGICNLACDYCFVEYRVQIDINKTIEKMESILSRFDPSKSCFRIECIGEVTLYPRVIEYLRNKSEKEGYLIEVLSNGVKTQEIMKESPYLKWVISLDGHTVNMNRSRKLNAVQIERILETVIALNADIQCVYYRQTIDEMNAFISYLKGRNYKGFLHIFPHRLGQESPGVYLDYKHLVEADFIPSYEYFERWKYIYEHQKRKFTCDFFKNGFVYRIMRDGDTVKKFKCDCAGGNFKHLYGEEIEQEFSEADCGTCINHFEYNNVDRLNNILPIGVAGELCNSGDGLLRGY